ncbi:patatin-like phospholipase family protein [Vitiosangium sp. GDMCC 1.1324]|uniref:patatin-like phospholipase family protein n=1 Tax=Vitiosangium sp. (strain GDMCC 1.1324) TaxID=2138576 RepID=UPI000D3C25C2|nr:patatin-like phospholipase family protein [Vitiosangium sp. GDMCC 1.1324]PTL75792.1 patatin [Vitiosangium sp. GDMCC 1.1324]
MPIRNLVFEGGGVKGMAYVGAVQVLEAKGLLGGVENVAGTSAGAITAALLAVGATAEELSSVLGSTDFATFMDGPGWVFRDASRLVEHYGLYEGNVFEQWCREQIGRITQRVLGESQSDLTFAQLEALAQREPGRFRKLFVVATNLTRQLPEVFSASTRPEVPLWLAVRMSMSIPLFFEAVQFEQCVYVDGGVSWNYPIDLFDGVRRQPALGSPAVPPEVGVSSETLGFFLGTAQQIEAARQNWQLLPVPITGIKSYTQALFSFMLHASTLLHVDEVALGRTVFIDNAGVSTTEFTLTDAQIQQLVDNGVLATTEWLARNADRMAPARAAG